MPRSECSLTYSASLPKVGLFLIFSVYFGNHPSDPGLKLSCQKSTTQVDLSVCSSVPSEFLMSETPDKEETFLQLVVSHQPALQAFVLSLLPGSPDVDDVVQEANAAVWQKRSDFEIGTNFKAWMFSVAKFKVMAHWRDQKRKKTWAFPEETLRKLIDEAADSTFESRDHRHDALRECLQQLRPADRGLILRRYYEGGSLKDVAAEVGRKAENLKGSLHRIRISLRTCVRSKLNVRNANP